MVEVRCRTSLDVKGEEWPKELPCRPMIGDVIVSRTKWGKFQLALQVVSVVFEPDNYGNWELKVELHMQEYQKQAGWSVRNFFEWYAPLTGKSVHYFI